MNGIARASDVERFRVLVARRLGLRFEDAKAGFLGEVLQRRLDASGDAAEAYLRRLDTSPKRAELAALACELTVGETYFLRHNEQFRALIEAALPERMRANAATRTLRFLSAGCASGEEAYSLAMILRDAVTDPSWEVSIRAVDLNPAALAKAAVARYSSWALRETPPEVQGRWFRPAGRELILDDAIRTAVRFEQRNLAEDDAELWQPRSFDIVFCRNVMMYFTPEQARALLARIVGALPPGAYLFLGHAETLRGLSDDFRLRHTHGTFYYQLKEAAGQPAPRPAPAIAEAAGADGQAVTLDEPWIDMIRQASERVAALTAVPSPIGQPDCAAPAHDLAPIFDLLRRERFADALALLRALPAAPASDPDLLLLEAMLLAHSGRPTAAEETCRRLLAIDELNAGAHYVFALCRESAGDRIGAVEHDRVAAYLDPAFAMPRLHLGLVARRAGAREEGRRELAEAAVLLEREDTSRLLLFGGGFSRDVLLGLCRSALRDCGGAP